MKKYIILILLGLAIALIAVERYNAKKVYQVPLILSDSSTRILVFINIKDSAFLFLWDTGSDISFIMKKHAGKVPVKRLDKVLQLLYILLEEEK